MSEDRDPLHRRQHGRHVGRAVRAGHLDRHDPCRRGDAGSRRWLRGRPVAGDDAGHDGAVAEGVDGGAAFTGQVGAVHDPPGEVVDVADAGVEDRDGDARTPVAGRPDLWCAGGPGVRRGGAGLVVAGRAEPGAAVGGDGDDRRAAGELPKGVGRHQRADAVDDRQVTTDGAAGGAHGAGHSSRTARAAADDDGGALVAGGAQTRVQRRRGGSWRCGGGSRRTREQDGEGRETRKGGEPCTAPFGHEHSP